VEPFILLLKFITSIHAFSNAPIWQKYFFASKFKIYLCHAMTFYEKYPQLKEKAFLTQMLTETVFTTMSLEDQQVPKDTVEAIVLSLLSDDKLENTKFIRNQVS